MISDAADFEWYGDFSDSPVYSAIAEEDENSGNGDTDGTCPGCHMMQWNSEETVSESAAL